VAGCTAPLAGGVSATLLVAGFPAGAPAAGLAATVGGAPAAVAAAEPAAGGALRLSLALPPFPGDPAGGPAQRAPVRVVLNASGWEVLAVHAEVTYLRAPRVVGAAFNGIGSQVRLSFDQETCGAGVAECAALLTPLAPLGAAPACTWARRDLLTVQLGAGATLLPGDNLTVWGGALTARGGASGAVGNVTVAVARPAFVAAPALRVVGPGEIGACDVARLVATTESARPLSFVWDVLGHPALSANLSNETGPELALRGAALERDVKYTLSVRGLTFLGAQARLPPLSHERRIV